MTRPPSRVGYLEAVLAAILWGSSGIFATHLFRVGVPPLSVAVLRPAVGLVFLAAFAVVWRSAAFKVSARGLLAMLLLGGVATAVFQVAYQTSMEAVGVPVTVALLYLAPAMVVMGAGPLLGEKPPLRRVALSLLSVAGVWLTVLGARGVDVQITPRGIGWGVLAGASYASYTLFGRYSSPRWGSIATVLYSTLGATVLLALGLPLAGRSIVLPPTPSAWTVLVLFGLLTIALAAFLFYDALGRIEAGRAAIASTMEPVVAALLATALLGQGLSGWGWIGLLLVVAGVAGAYGGEAAPEATPPAHE